MKTIECVVAVLCMVVYAWLAFWCASQGNYDGAALSLAVYLVARGTLTRHQAREYHEALLRRFSAIENSLADD